jgi:threonine aldolase
VESIKVCVYNSTGSVDSVVVGLVEGLSLQGGSILVVQEEACS